MSTFGKAIEVSLFGESHGECVGLTIHNLPPGVRLDENAIRKALEKRRSVKPYTTSRREKDEFDIVSGFFEGRTTGAPFTVVIPNKDIRPKDYKKSIMRPGHADYTAYLKYHGHTDYRGGGHFSGRLTAPLVVLGEVCRQILDDEDLIISSHIMKIHTVKGPSFYDDTVTIDNIKTLYSSDFPVIDEDYGIRFRQAIEKARADNDSVGGIIETIIMNPYASLGEPFFGSFESILSHLLYSIPAVKAIAFGKGFALTDMLGSMSNDEMAIEEGRVSFTSNNMGGILGGITTGQTIIFSTAIKPTPSIGKSLRTVDMDELRSTTTSTSGRHDSCIVPRVIPVINALCHYAVLEMTMRNEGLKWKH